MKINEVRKKLINDLKFDFEKQIIKAAKRANFYSEQFANDLWEISRKYIDEAPIMNV